MTLEEHRAFFSKFAKHLGLRIIEDIHNRNSLNNSYHVKFVEAQHHNTAYVVDSVTSFETEFEFISDISLADAYQLVVNFLLSGCEIKISKEIEIADNITNYSWEKIKIPKMSSEEELMVWFAANWGDLRYETLAPVTHPSSPKQAASWPAPRVLCIERKGLGQEA